MPNAQLDGLFDATLALWDFRACAIVLNQVKIFQGRGRIVVGNY